jgi:hypothetical protein
MRSENRPQCSWVSVVDGSGRQRLEMRWSPSGTVTALPGPTGLMATARAA